MEMIFFDVANTLLYKPRVYEVMHEILTKEGLDIPIDHIRQVHKQLSEVIKFPDTTSAEFYTDFNREFLFALGIIPEKRLVEEIFENCKYLPWKTFDDAGSIEDLDLRIGVISNWDHTLKDKLKEFFSLDFEIVIGSKDFGTSKPDPSIFKEAINKSGCEPKEIMYIGDSIKLDMVESLKLGIRSVLIDRDDVYPYYSGERVKSLVEIKNLL